MDSIGQQLPYVDYYEVILLGSREILEAKAISGEYNMGGAWADLASFPLLVENADKAGYTVRMYPGLLWGGSVSWAYNYTSKDPVLREIFNDLRFRRALSHAINRVEFGEVFNLGLTEPRQAAPPADWSFYDESFGRKYLEYDLDLANQLLDETGLEWNADRSHRLRPDGEPLILQTEIQELFGILDEWRAVALGTPEYVELGKQMVRINDENIWYNVVTGSPPSISHAVVVSAIDDSVMNVRDPVSDTGWWIIEMLWIDQ